VVRTWVNRPPTGGEPHWRPLPLVPSDDGALGVSDVLVLVLEGYLYGGIRLPSDWGMVLRN